MDKTNLLGRRIKLDETEEYIVLGYVGERNDHHFFLVMDADDNSKWPALVSVFPVAKKDFEETPK